MSIFPERFTREDLMCIQAQAKRQCLDDEHAFRQNAGLKQAPIYRQEDLNFYPLPFTFSEKNISHNGDARFGNGDRDEYAGWTQSECLCKQ